MTKVLSVTVVCQSCGGTGVGQGFAERGGVGVVCHTCDGKGCVTLEYTLFEGRRRRDDIQVVAYPQYYVLNVEEALKFGGISYDDFLAGKLPTVPAYAMKADIGLPE